jgi:hypothetical protein
MKGLDGCVRNRRGNLGLSAPVLNNLGSWFFDFERDRLPDGRDHVFVMAFLAASILPYHAYHHVQR